MTFSDPFGLFRIDWDEAREAGFDSRRANRLAQAINRAINALANCPGCRDAFRRRFGYDPLDHFMYNQGPRIVFKNSGRCQADPWNNEVIVAASSMNMSEAGIAGMLLHEEIHLARGRLAGMIEAASDAFFGEESNEQMEIEHEIFPPDVNLPPGH